MTYDSTVRGFRAVSLVLTAAMGFVPVMPPEHAHETEADGHVRIVVHQHAQTHALGHVPGGHRHHGTVDHPDEPILTLSTVFTSSAPQTLAIPVRSVVAIIQPLHADARHVSIGFVERLIHGPPRAPSGLRAPPSSPA
jgi:hypothetical protein